MEQTIVDLIAKMLKETNPDKVKKILVELYQITGRYQREEHYLANDKIVKAARDFCSTPNHKNKQRLETLLQQIKETNHTIQ